ncbi:hypothetical protein HAPAU_35710 [Halalkalicoccus paucihalophilus]|uniref:Uncharacterized protein n=1 Tax=Halalkalicoccus paucihalophilus TaxID=1008153 RepID=A0A151AA60_9EURY|nr:hypothetical protein HAPAU_35710 [Halalkalicoccus paucihalophilus]
MVASIVDPLIRLHLVQNISQALFLQEISLADNCSTDIRVNGGRT